MLKQKPIRALKAFRANSDLNQKEMAKIMGISHSSYVAKENGERDFKTSEIKKAKEHLGIDISIFFIN